MAKDPNTDAALEVSDQAEYMEYLKNAPIADFAKFAGIGLDEAVNRRVAAAIADAPPRLEVTARPVEPQGNLYGFASVKLGGVTVDDFKILADKDGKLFVGISEQVGELSASQQEAIDKEVARVKSISADDYQKMLDDFEKGRINSLELTSMTQADANALMKQFSTSIDASLAQYASTYQNVGVTLGQSIEEGFKSALQSVQSTFDYFKGLQGQLTGQAASIATQAVRGTALDCLRWGSICYLDRTALDIFLV